MTIALIVPGMYLGVGCNSLTGDTNGEALLFDPAQPIEDAGGQEIAFNLRIIESSKELAEALNVAASASFSGYGFKASAEAKYISEQQVSKYSLYALVSVSVKNPDKVIRNRRLKPEVEQFLKDRGWDEFENTYGSEYMSGIITGGSYYGLIQIETEDFSQRQELAVKISGSGWGGQLDSQVEQELKELLKNKKISITVLQSGGSGDVIETTLDEMIEQGKNFPQLVKDNPIAYQGIFAKYRSTIPLPPNIDPGTIDRQHQLTVMEELGRKYLEYKDLRADLDYILRNRLNFEEYQNLSDEEWQQIQEKLQQDFEGVSTQINQLVEQARSCRQSFTKCKFPTEYYRLTTELPKIEGQTMILKQMEENIRKLQLQVIGVEDKTGVLKSQTGVLENKTRVLENKTTSLETRTRVITTSGGLNLNDRVIIKGKNPLQVRRYGPFKGNTQYNTNYPVSDWEAVIGGFRALQGDIQEDDRGNIIQVYTTVRSGRWYVYADFRSHHRNEDWYVWVLFISKALMY